MQISPISLGANSLPSSSNICASVEEIGRPLEPDMRDYIIEMWNFLKGRNSEMHAEQFGCPPPYSFWGWEWWEPDGLESHIRKIKEIEGEEFFQKWIQMDDEHQLKSLREE